MDRRVGGILMLVMVLVGTLVAGHVAPKALGGRPVLAPIPGPPAVGSCLVQDPGDQSWAYDGSVDFAVMPPLKFDDSCRGPHYGEVVAVLPSLPPQRPATTDGSTMTGPGYEMWQECPQRSDDYVGTPHGPDLMLPGDSGWSNLTTVMGSFAGPGPIQKAFGQTWVACILVAPMTLDNGVRTAYSGSAKSAVATHQLPLPFTQCTDDPTMNTPVTTCGVPHLVEVLGFGQFFGPRAASIPTSSCRTMAESMTGMPDVTAGGRLRVQAVMHRMDGVGQPQSADGPLPSGYTEYGSCGVQVVGKGKLTGTLIGLGTRPVPLTG